MKESRYYTPTIDEFHVGFEYEYPIEYDEGASGEDVYYKTSFRFEYKWIEFPENFHVNKRVKYLDEQDILDLGFSINGAYNSSVNPGISSHIDCEFLAKQFDLEYKLTYITWFSYPTSTKEDLSALIRSGVATEHRLVKIQRRDSDSVEYDTIFSGECKNKSELKRILKAVGYGY